MQISIKKRENEKLFSLFYKKAKVQIPTISREGHWFESNRNHKCIKPFKRLRGFFVFWFTHWFTQMDCCLKFWCLFVKIQESVQNQIKKWKYKVFYNFIRLQQTPPERSFRTTPPERSFPT